MGTITFEIHPITLTSPRNPLVIIFKSILILFAFDIFCNFFFSSFKHIMHEYIRERINTSLCKLKHHNFVILKHIDVIHDWRALVVKWLFMPVRTYVIYLLETYVTILCDWLIL